MPPTSESRCCFSRSKVDWLVEIGTTAPCLLLANVTVLVPLRPCISYVAVPDNLPVGIAIGKHGGRLRFIRDNVECVIVPSERNIREVYIRITV